MRKVAEKRKAKTSRRRPSAAQQQPQPAMPANLLRFMYTGGTWIVQGEGGGDGFRANPDLAFVIIDVIL
jgi:hypothetical protein